MLRWQIGDVTVTRVVENVSAELAALLFPMLTRDDILGVPWLRPHFVDEQGRMLFSFHSLLVESRGKRILVDTCVGNDKERPVVPEWHLQKGPYLQTLAGAGATRENVDYVLCTHMHIDHVGWNTMKDGDRWVPTFPNARYLFGRIEWEHWKDEPEEFGPIITDSVRPIVDAGLADLVEQDHRVTDEVRLEPTPGHTPGHVSVRIESKGERAVITGDLLHHPYQMAHPEISPFVDWNADKSRETRRDFLARMAGSDVLVIGTHFAEPTAGAVVRDGEAYRFDVTPRGRRS